MCYGSYMMIKSEVKVESSFFQNKKFGENMNLSKLKKAVDSAIESAIEYGESLEEIVVSLQIDDLSKETVWAKEDVELHYDNNCQASGCVLVGFPAESDDAPIAQQERAPQWILVKTQNSPHGIPVLLWSKEWVDEDFNPTSVREGHFVEGEGYTSCGWNPCQDVFTTEENSSPYMWAKKIGPRI